MRRPVAVALVAALPAVLGITLRDGRAKDLSHDTSMPSWGSSKKAATMTTTCKSANVALPTVALVVRTFWQHEGMLNRMLSNVGMFATDLVERVVVLDDSEKDKAVGHGLQEKFPGVAVWFEAFPNINLKPANQGMARARTVGYNRMLWSSFYLDKYTQAEIIGVMDTDAQIINLVRPDLVLNGNGKIWARMVRPDNWRGDLEILDSGMNLDAMYVDNLPMFFWRSTFAGARNHIQKKWGKNNFDLAFEAFQDRLFSPQNILYQYGLAFQKDAYEPLEIQDLDRSHVPLALGLNKASNDNRVVASCCLTYQLSETICPPRNVLHEEEVNGFSYKDGYEYLSCLRKEVSSSMVDAMMDRCLVEVTAGTWKPRGDAVGDSTGNLRASSPPPRPLRDDFERRLASLRASLHSSSKLGARAPTLPVALTPPRSFGDLERRLASVRARLDSSSKAYRRAHLAAGK
mmetsp:Transcript_5260/g.9458  ORF Transcript_5260/g.9458 Transcript_5260/m.9458 type:complete len:460 (+) Transcript_5260:98-1477(+)